MKIKHFIRKMSEKSDSPIKYIAFFIVISYGFSWIFYLLVRIFPEFGIIQFPFISYSILSWIGNYGPFVAAITLTYFKEGKKGVKQLLKRGIAVRFKKVWLLPLLFLMPLVIIGSFLVSALIERLTLNFELFSSWWEICLILLLGFFLILIITGIGEEFGWRGYALDRLQKKWSALTSSIIIGTMWAFWHIFNFIPDNPFDFFSLYIPLLIALSIVFTWMHNNTSGSVFVALVLHVLYDLFSIFIPLLLSNQSTLSHWFLLIGFVITAIIIILVAGPTNFNRKKNGRELNELQNLSGRNRET
jgi:membrane protease YdiL (CAAX protease family)